MPKSFPRAPVPFLSALLSPLAWLYGRPDLFDSYSAGVMLLQLAGEFSSDINLLVVLLRLCLLAFFLDFFLPFLKSQFVLACGDQLYLG